MSTQLQVKAEEQTFLNTISSTLKEGYDRDLVIMALRTVEQLYFRRGSEEAKTQLQRTGQTDWNVDQHWSDNELRGSKD